jgi:hypothetical protein
MQNFILFKMGPSDDFSKVREFTASILCELYLCLLYFLAVAPALIEDRCIFIADLVVARGQALLRRGHQIMIYLM